MNIYPELFRIALKKAHTKEERNYINQLIILSEAIYTIHQSLPYVIRAGQVYLNKPHPKYSKTKKREIDEYAEDAKQIEQEQIEECKSLDNALEICGPLYGALKMLTDEDSLYKQFSPDDLGLSEILIKLAEKQLEILKKYLRENGQTKYMETPYV